jgi:hypothetical protein
MLRLGLIRLMGIVGVSSDPQYGLHATLSLAEVSRLNISLSGSNR